MQQAKTAPAEDVRPSRSFGWTRRATWWVVVVAVVQISDLVLTGHGGQL